MKRGCGQPPPQVANVLRRLKDVRESGDGWMARCPAHDDHVPSLSIGIGEEGRVLVHCHRGCSTANICRALDIEPSDLFPSQANGNGKVQSTIETTYDYCDEAVKLLFQVVRIQPKSFRQRRPDGHGGWTWNLSDTRRVLYRLPELLAADPSEWVLIPEGEKDANRLAKLGFCATTTSGGTSAWHKTELSPLYGRKVCLLADSDGPGRKRVRDMAEALYAKAAEVRFIEFDDLPARGDVSDWIDSFPQETDIFSLLVERIENAEPYEPGSGSPPGSENVVEEPNIGATPKGIEARQWQPFPTSVLPEPLQSFVLAASRALDCDPSFIALPTLAMAASCIGNSRVIRLKRGWEEPCILWTIVVADSGAGKSPAFEMALQLLRRRQDAAFRKNDEAIALYERDMLEYERALKAWKAKPKGQDHPPTQPQAPTCERFIVCDTTIEALAPLLLLNERGLLLARDELSGLLMGFNQYKARGGSDVAYWLELHDAGVVTVDRKTAVGPIHVRRGSVSICGTIQPVALQKIMTSEYRENGLMARMLFAAPPRLIPKWTEAMVSRNIEKAMADLVGGLLAIKPTVNEDGEAEPVLVRLGAEAKSFFKRFHEEHRKVQEVLTGEHSTMAAKLPGTVARLALLFHCAKMTKGKSQARPDEIGLESMKSAVELGRWFFHEWARVVDAMDECKERFKSDRLLGWIRLRGSVTVRDLVRGNRKYRGATAEAKHDLEALVSERLLMRIDVTPSVKGGKPTVQYKVVEGVEVDDTPADAPENEGIGTVDSVDTVGTNKTPRKEPTQEPCEDKEVYDPAEVSDLPGFVPADERPIPVCAEVESAGGNR